MLRAIWKNKKVYQKEISRRAAEPISRRKRRAGVEEAADPATLLAYFAGKQIRNGECQTASDHGT